MPHKRMHNLASGISSLDLRSVDCEVIKALLSAFRSKTMYALRVVKMGISDFGICVGSTRMIGNTRVIWFS